MTNPLDKVQPEVCILDSAPVGFNRLLVLINSRGYAASWLHVQRPVFERKDKKTGQMVPLATPETEVHRELVIISDDGVLYTDAPLPNAKPIKELDVDITLDCAPANHLLWSGAGVKAFIAGDRPCPVSVFNDVYDVVDQFMDFHGSFGEQREMCELVACYVLSTYMLDALPVTGYLWPNGEPGSGKSHLLQVIAVMGYLGQFILAGSSFASIRDMAGYGATLCFDDAEKIMDSKGDPNKQALLLAGNRKGTTVTIKEPDSNGKWQTKHINAFCPKCFSAIGLPNDTLSSRTIFIPLLASDNSVKASSDPLDFESWPVDRQRLIDDLWAVSLTNVRKLSRHDKLVSGAVGLSGRPLQPWRAVFAVAMWLEAEGYPGLFDRMKRLLDAYGKEESFSGLTHHRLVLAALRQIVDLHPGGWDITFATKDLNAMITKIARENDLMDENCDGDYINSRSLGWRLKRMRLKKPKERSANAREWIVSEGVLKRQETAAGIPLPIDVTNDRNVTNGTKPAPETPKNVVNDVSDKNDVVPAGYIRQSGCQRCGGEGCEYCRIAAH